MHMLAAAPSELSRRDRILAFAAAMLVLLLSALDQTIVATAMPRIACAPSAVACALSLIWLGLNASPGSGRRIC